MSEKPLRVGIVGCGFWAGFQVAGWKEVPSAEVAGLYNRTRARAEALSARFGGVPVFDRVDDLLASGIDVVDIITAEETHRDLTLQAARRGVHAICQKPMAPSLEHCREMVHGCREQGVRLMIHDNWRWQTPIRRFKEQLERGEIGRPFRARVVYAWADPAYLLSTTSVVPANREFAHCLRTGSRSETEGDAYLHTMEMVFAAYDSAAAHRVVSLPGGEP